MTYPIRLHVPLLALVASLAATGPAIASGQSAADRETAKLLGREGHKALLAKDFDTAADRLERADKLIHAPTFLLLLARARIGQGRLVEAYDLYREIIRETVDPKSGAFRKAVEAAEKEVGPLKARLAKVSVQVDGPLPNGVKITLNGVNVPKAALGAERLVDPGRVVARAEAPGFRAAESKPIILQDGQQGPVLRLRLRPLPEPTVIVQAEPNSGMELDSSTGTSQTTLGYVGLGLGGAAAAVWAVSGVMAVLKHSELMSRCGPNSSPSKCSLPGVGNDSELESDFKTTATIADYSAITAGVLSLAGLTLLLTAPDSSDDVAVGPSITPFIGVGQLGATGRF